jgi:hypothetical protein
MANQLHELSAMLQPKPSGTPTEHGGIKLPGIVIRAVKDNGKVQWSGWTAQGIPIGKFCIAAVASQENSA